MANKAVITIRNEDTFKKLKVIANLLGLSVGEVITKSIESTMMFDEAVNEMYKFLLSEETKDQKSNKNK